MKVHRFMAENVVTISKNADIGEAAALLKEHSIRHLPVVENGKLVGLVTEGDVRGAIFPAMLEDITVEDLMINDPVTVNLDTMLEDAARLVYEHKIGCLPVLDDHGNLEGIITVVDMLAALVNLMGFLSDNSRMDLILPDRPEAFEEVCGIIQRNGGRVISVSLTHLIEDQPIHLFRLEKINLDPIVGELEDRGYRVVSRLD